MLLLYILKGCALIAGSLESFISEFSLVHRLYGSIIFLAVSEVASFYRNDLFACFDGLKLFGFLLKVSKWVGFNGLAWDWFNFTWPGIGTGTKNDNSDLAW